jgi:ABC-type transport system involved in multi-copper enzyme maturation permease subunit
MVWILTKYVLTAALRDRLLLGFFLLLFVGVSLSIFIGSSAINESDQFSLVFAASGLRIGSNLALILFIVFYLRRSFESRDVEYLLSRPISKLQFLMAHFFAFSLLALMVSILVTVTLMIMPLVASSEPDFILWGLSLWVELNIMAAIAVFFSLVLSSAVTASLATFSFYVLSRLIGDILGIIEAGHTVGIYALMEKTMLVISIFIPRLDLMAQSAWLLYGVTDNINWPFILGQGIIFTGFVYTAALLDLNKRQF